MKSKSIFVVMLTCAILVGCDSEDSVQNSPFKDNATTQEDGVAFLDAEDMCEKWVADCGLSVGNDKKGRIVAIGSSAADVGQFAKWGMDREQMRNVLAKEAYLNAIGEIAQSIETVSESSEKKGRSDDSESRIITSRSEVDLLGVRIVHQCETFNGGENAFCVAQVIVYDKDFSAQLKGGRVGNFGAMSIHDWLGQRDCADMLGVRYYCDDKGKGWLIGGYAVSVEKAAERKAQWRKKAEDLMTYALGGSVSVYRKSSQNYHVRMDEKDVALTKEESFEDCYYGSDGAIRTVFGEPDDEVFSTLEDHVDIRPAYAGVRGSIFLERESVSPVNGAKTKMFIVAAQVPENK